LFFCAIHSFFCLFRIQCACINDKQEKKDLNSYWCLFFFSKDTYEYKIDL
jgi:hypothetical protein